MYFLESLSFFELAFVFMSRFAALFQVYEFLRTVSYHNVWE